MNRYLLASNWFNLVTNIANQIKHINNRTLELVSGYLYVANYHEFT